MGEKLRLLTSYAAVLFSSNSSLPLTVLTRIWPTSWCDTVGKPTLWLSSGKKTLVDQKQVYRHKSNGRMKRDTIALRDEELDGEPLLEPVMQNGRRLKEPEPLEAAQKRFQEQFTAMDDKYKAIREPDRYPVHLSAELETLQTQVVREVKIKELGES